MSNEQNTWFIRHHFSQLSNVVLNKSGNRPTKRCQVTRHVFKSLLINIQEFAWIEVFYEIVDFFVLNVWFNWFSLHALSQKEETHSEPAVHKTNYTFDFQYHSVSLDVQVQVKVPSQVSVNLSLKGMEINHCSLKVLVLLLVCKLLEL